jgi:hypothetical protein
MKRAKAKRLSAAKASGPAARGQPPVAKAKASAAGKLTKEGGKRVGTNAVGAAAPQKLVAARVAGGSDARISSPTERWHLCEALDSRRTIFFNRTCHSNVLVRRALLPC